MPRESSDVYSVCATIYSLLVGEEPHAEVVNSRIRDVSGDLIGHDFIEEGGVMEVLIPPLRQGLKGR